MFASLLGPLPRPPLHDNEDRYALVAVIRAQEAAGLEPIIDAGFGKASSVVERWQYTASLTDRLVKQALVGPYSVGIATGPTNGRSATADALADEVMAAAVALNADLVALVAAGCPFIEIHEPGAIEIGADESRRSLFRNAHRRLLQGVSESHASLAITGGNADAAGIETLLAAPYGSLAVDLIAGPDNWRLVAATPGERGIVCGALSVVPDADDRVEVLIWAAGYAASTGGRGPSRVGLATASSLAAVPWETAVRKMTLLGEAARVADLPPDERAHAVDPRSLDSRSAAAGRYLPRRQRRG